MCNPYLKDLKARLLQLEDFARSTNLKCNEVWEAEQLPEQQEPLAFTVRAVTQQVLSRYSEVEEAYREAATWNSLTDKQLIAEFERELAECRDLLQDAVNETRLLHARVRRIGLTDEYVGRFPEFTVC